MRAKGRLESLCEMQRLTTARGHGMVLAEMDGPCGADPHALLAKQAFAKVHGENTRPCLNCAGGTTFAAQLAFYDALRGVEDGSSAKAVGEHRCFRWEPRGASSLLYACPKDPQHGYPYRS